MLAASLAAGVVFGAGLAIAGMTSPQRVIAFLDVTGGRWDPTLAFVLGAAVPVAFVGFRLFGPMGPALRDSASRGAGDDRGIDARLVLGAALFGVGWGASGYCPGPALAQLAAPTVEALWFIPAMLVGLWIGNRI